MRKKIGNLVPKNTFARGVGVLVGGNVTAQLLMVAAAPLLTRLYTPEDFGLLAVYTALLALFSVVSSLRYELAIPIPESSNEAGNLVILSLVIVCLMTIISGVMVFIAGSEIAELLNTPMLGQYFWLLPVGIFLSGIYKVFNYSAVRNRLFVDITKTRLSQSLSTLLFQGFGYGLGGVALLIGQACGQGMGTVKLFRRTILNGNLEFSNRFEIWNTAVKYKQFPLFSTWSGLFNTIGGQLPALMFAAFFGASVAGIYALASRFILLPMSIVGGAVGKVFLSDAAAAKRENRLTVLVESVHQNLSEIIAPAVLLLLFLGPDIFAFAFGENWRQAGVFTQYMAPFLYIQFSTSPLTVLHSVLGKQAKGVFFHGMLLLVRTISIGIGILFEDVMLAVCLFSLSSMVCWFGFLYWILSLAGSNGAAVIVKSMFSAICVPLLAITPFVISYFNDLSALIIIPSFILFILIIMCRFYTLMKKRAN